MMKNWIYRLVVWYLRGLARWQLKKYRSTTIIGVTGSVGKTSAMMAIKAVLQDDYKVKVSKKANSEIGIPLDILGFKVKNYRAIDWLGLLPMAVIKLLSYSEKFDVYIVEMGIDSPYKPKNMEWLLSLIQPDIGVFLNALPVHSEAFEKSGKEAVELIASEKGKLITSLPKNGWAILNGGDKRVAGFGSKTKARVIMMKDSDLVGLVEAIAQVFGIDKEKALIKFEKNYQSPPGRMTIINGIKNTTLIDSSYNASKASMLLGLEVLADPSTGTGLVGAVKGKGRRVAVLGDMRELGGLAKREHEAVAKRAVKVAEVIVLVGPLMKEYFLPKAIELGFDQKNLYWFVGTHQAAKALANKIIKPYDRILIKASQNSLLFEIIVEELMFDKDQADKLLCRRGKFWDIKRKAI